MQVVVVPKEERGGELALTPLHTHTIPSLSYSISLATLWLAKLDGLFVAEWVGKLCLPK